MTAVWPTHSKEAGHQLNYGAESAPSSSSAADSVDNVTVPTASQAQAST